VEGVAEPGEVLAEAVEHALPELPLHRGTPAARAATTRSAAAEQAAAVAGGRRRLARGLAFADRFQRGLERGPLAIVELQRLGGTRKALAPAAPARGPGGGRAFGGLRGLVAQRSVGDLEYALALAHLDLGIDGEPGQQRAVAVVHRDH